MKPRKKDLRISRKSGATNVGACRSLPKSTRSTKPLLKSTSGIHAERSVRSRRPKRKTEIRKVRPAPAAVPNDPTPIHSSGTSTSNEVYRRRRVDTTEYIKKRFLYDVPEPPRRLQRRPKCVHRSPAALVAASSAKLSERRKARNSTSILVKNNRERRSSRKNDIFDEEFSQRHMGGARQKRKFAGNGVEPSFMERHSDHPPSSWDFPDFLDANSPTHSIYDGMEPGDCATLEFHANNLPKTSGKSSSRQSSGRRRETFGNNGCRNKGGGFYPGAFYSNDQSSPEHPSSDDIIQLPSDRSEHPVGKLKHLERALADDFSDRSHSSILPERNAQPPTEELEEELLAPELSILAESACLSASDGSLVNTVPPGGCMVTTSIANLGGCSRRKSPVRPMQVLRTKTPVATNHLATYGIGTENNPAKYTRRQFPLDDCQMDEGLNMLCRPTETGATNLEHCFGGSKANSQSASLMRMSQPNSRNGSGASRLVHDHPLDDLSSVPLNEEVGRNSGPTSKTTRSGKAALVKSLLLAHNTPSARHRPTILRRNSQSTKQEFDEESQKAASRAIGAMPSAPSSARRSNKKSVPPESTGPTKLLQLITATSLSSSNLTASEKLFGRRSAPQKASLVTNVTMPVVESRYMDTVKTPVTASGSCRYAVLRGSTNGKRYIVLGNNAIFDRSNIAPVAPTSAIQPPPTSLPPSESCTSDMDTAETLLEGLHESAHSEFNPPRSATLEFSDADSMSTLIATALAAT